MIFDELSERCDIIEACYEFLLAYAAKGVPGDQGMGPLREYLRGAVKALTGLGARYRSAVAQEAFESPDRYAPFLEVVERDASDSIAAIELVLAQPTISSQVIDNLNASIHFRALLTDLFLIDEVFKLQRKLRAPAEAGS
ncbi:MAG TPA: hypothetical protein VK419_11250 [Bryobacteraceae bacterium]|nr:hypothetical protein [Bryobacteraceae bacterium]